MTRSFAVLAILGILAMPALAQEALVPSKDGQADSPDMINLLHQREWVRLNEEGVVKGTLMTLSAENGKEARVAAKIVISKDGQTVLETVSDVGGVFSLAGLQPGTYALQVRGDLTRAAYALHVLPSDSDHLTSELEVFASIIPTEVADEIVGSNLVPAWEAGQDLYYRDHASDPIAQDRKFNDSYQVALRDGNLVGRVSRPGWTFPEQDLTGSIAQIVREGEVVAKAAVNRDGFFTVENLAPGVYDLFVSGDDGFAILAFEAVEPSEPIARGNDGKVHFVSTRHGRASDCLCCEMIRQPEIACCGEVVVEEVVVVDPCTSCGQDPCVDPCGCCAPSPIAGGGFAGGGGFYGGGGGGGGGFGGAGGLGGLLGAAGLAIGIAALADKDDGFNQNQPTPLVNP